MLNNWAVTGFCMPLLRHPRESLAFGCDMFLRFRNAGAEGQSLFQHPFDWQLQQTGSSSFSGEGSLSCISILQLSILDSFPIVSNLGRSDFRRGSLFGSWAAD